MSEFADVHLFPIAYRGDPMIASISRNWLDGQRNLAIGKLAPEIEGHDLAGRPLRLSDYRGKVVVLVFWTTWSDQYMLEIPHERALTARLQGRPFALLGINCDEGLTEARLMAERHTLAWPQWYDGDPTARHTGDGPIRANYHIQGIPAIFVLDEQGIIRERDVRGKALDDAVDKLLNRPTTPPGAGPAAPGSDR